MIKKIIATLKYWLSITWDFDSLYKSLWIGPLLIVWLDNKKPVAYGFYWWWED